MVFGVFTCRMGSVVLPNHQLASPVKNTPSVFVRSISVYFYDMPYIIAILVFLVYLLIRHFSGNRLTVETELSKKPKSSIAGFREGTSGRISGSVVYGGRTLKAPLSGRLCSYYHVRVERDIGGRNSQYHTIMEEKKAGDVIIRDGDAYALVQTGKLMESYIVPDKAFSSGFLNDAGPAMEAYLHKYGQSSEDFLGMNRDLRYHEGVLEEGETLNVSGKGLWKSTKDLKLKLPVDKVLLIVPFGEESVVMTDDTGIHSVLNS